MVSSYCNVHILVLLLINNLMCLGLESMTILQRDCARKNRKGWSQSQELVCFSNTERSPKLMSHLMMTLILIVTMTTKMIIEGAAATFIETKFKNYKSITNSWNETTKNWNETHSMLQKSLKMSLSIVKMFTDGSNGVSKSCMACVMVFSLSIVVWVG